MEHAWPGNVRELENAIEHAFVVCDRPLIEPEDLPAEIHRESLRLVAGCDGNRAYNSKPKGARIDREALLAILDDSEWNKAEAARKIGVSRTAVWKYMKKWGIPLQPPKR
jgi:transcriptional regulator of acetoin/glycerol metabolism